jgi:hypothetical protein
MESSRFNGAVPVDVFGAVTRTRAADRGRKDLAMPTISERFTIGVDPTGMTAISKIKDATHLLSNADAVRASLAVMYDVVVAEDRGYSIILRSDSTGAEFTYSPHRPAHAVMIKQPEFNNNVILKEFGRNKLKPKHVGKSAAKNILSPVG